MLENLKNIAQNTAILSGRV